MEQKIKLLVWSDSPTAPTGFGHVAKETLTRLHGTGCYDIKVVGINFLSHHKNTFPFEVIPAPSNSREFMGMKSLPKEAYEFGPDLIFLFQDIFNIKRVIPNLRRACPLARIVIYFPIDASPIPQEWVETIRSADRAITYTEFARKTIHEAAGSEIPVDVVGHGCNKEIFHRIEKEERLAFRRERLGWDDDTFGVVSVNRFQPRKNVPATIEAFNFFQSGYRVCTRCDKYSHALSDRCQINDCGVHLVDADGVPGTRLYLHMNTAEVTMGPLPTHSLENYVASCGPWKGEDVVLMPEPGCYGLEDPLEDVNRIYNAADVFICSTFGEGWGMTIQEALMTGTRVIAPRHTSIPEVARGCATLVDNAARIRLGNDSTQARNVVSVEDLTCALFDEFLAWKTNKGKVYVEDYQVEETWETASAKFHTIFAEEFGKPRDFADFTLKSDTTAIVRWLSASEAMVLSATPVFRGLESRFETVYVDVPVQCRPFIGRDFKLLPEDYDIGPQDRVYDLDFANVWEKKIADSQDGRVGQSLTEVLAEELKVNLSSFRPIYTSGREAQDKVLRRLQEIRSPIFPDEFVVGLSACAAKQHDWMGALPLTRLLHGRDGFTPVIISTGKLERVGIFSEVAILDALTPDEAIAALALCTMLVSTDSFLIEGASALGVKTLALMGPTGTLERLKHSDAEIISLPRPCMPCWRKPNQICHVNREDPHVSQCLTDITAKSVMDKIESMAKGRLNPMA